MIFLIEYDQHAGKIASTQTFDESQRHAALEARLKLELDFHRRGVEREIVLLEADDEQALRRTHRRYFEDLAELVRTPQERL